MRKENWPALMLDEIASHDAPFSWGVNDCCIFAADVTFAITGVDHMVAFRGRYTDRPGAQDMLLTAGCKSLRQYMSGILGPLRKPMATAQRGDIVFQEGRGLLGSRLGICTGSVAAFIGEDDRHSGVVYEPTLLSDGYWRG